MPTPLSPLRARLSPIRGAVYVEYLLLLSAAMAVSIAGVFVLLPRVAQPYEVAAAATRSPFPSSAHGHAPSSPAPERPGGGQEGNTEGHHPPVPEGPDTPADTPLPGPADPAPEPTPEGPAPVPGPPLDFGEAVLDWDNTDWRVTSPPVEVDNLPPAPTPTVEGDGNPIANTTPVPTPAPTPESPAPDTPAPEDEAPQDGGLTIETDIEIDAPPPGGTYMATLHIHGRSGKFKVHTRPIPNQVITNTNSLALWIPMNPDGRSFSISGQGNPGALMDDPNAPKKGKNIRPSAQLPNGRVTHGTASHGFTLLVDAPTRGGTYTIIITIDGHTSAFTLNRPY